MFGYIQDILALDMGRRETLGVQAKPRVPFEPPVQPGEVAVTDETVLGDPQRAKTEQLREYSVR